MHRVIDKSQNNCKHANLTHKQTANPENAQHIMITDVADPPDLEYHTTRLLQRLCNLAQAQPRPASTQCSNDCYHSIEKCNLADTVKPVHWLRSTELAAAATLRTRPGPRIQTIMVTKW